MIYDRMDWHLSVEDLFTCQRWNISRNRCNKPWEWHAWVRWAMQAEKVPRRARVDMTYEKCLGSRRWPGQ